MDEKFQCGHLHDGNTEKTECTICCKVAEVAKNSTAFKTDCAICDKAAEAYRKAVAAISKPACICDRWRADILTLPVEEFKEIRKGEFEKLRERHTEIAANRREVHNLLILENKRASVNAVIRDVKYMCEQILAEKKLLEDHWMAIVIARANIHTKQNTSACSNPAEVMAKQLHVVSEECEPLHLSKCYLGRKSENDEIDISVEFD